MGHTHSLCIWLSGGACLAKGWRGMTWFPGLRDTIRSQDLRCPALVLTNTQAKPGLQVSHLAHGQITVEACPHLFNGVEIAAVGGKLDGGHAMLPVYAGLIQKGFIVVPHIGSALRSAEPMCGCVCKSACMCMHASVKVCTLARVYVRMYVYVCMFVFPHFPTQNAHMYLTGGNDPTASWKIHRRFAKEF